MIITCKVHEHADTAATNFFIDKFYFYYHFFAYYTLYLHLLCLYILTAIKGVQFIT